MCHHRSFKKTMTIRLISNGLCIQQVNKCSFIIGCDGEAALKGPMTYGTTIFLVRESGDFERPTSSLEGYLGGLGSQPGV